MIGILRYRWLREALRPLRGSFREVLLASLFINLLVLATPIFVLQVYDRVVFHAGLATLQGLVVGMLAVIMFDFVLRETRSRIFQRAALHIDVQVGRALFDKLLALPLRELESRPTSHWQSLFNDVQVVRNGVSGPNALLLIELPFALLFFGFVWVIAAPVAWVLGVILPLFLLLAWRSSEVLRQKGSAERTAQLNREAVVSELMAARATVKTLALDQAVRDKWSERHAETIERSLDRGSRGDRYFNLGHGVGIATTVAMTGVGAISILDGAMTIGSLIAANILANRIVGPFNQLVRVWRDLGQLRQAGERLDRVFQAATERAESTVQMDRPHGTLRLENLVFRYAPDLGDVVDNVSLQVGPGGLHAIIGPNASGKTTLLKLMRGLYDPSEGRVLIDGADVSQFTRMELARWIGYLDQDTVLFGGTIRENISMSKPDASDQEVLRAARLAGVHQFCIDLPDGYGTEIGEAGASLSAGMRQRIGLARTLVADPPVMLLDEPSSNLDRDAERRLSETLSLLAKDHTVILVTHSPVLLSACNNIVVMDKGRIEMGGPATKVLEKLQVRKPTAPTATTEAESAAPVASSTVATGD